MTTNNNDNDNNKNAIRDNLKNLFKKKCNSISDIEIDDLEIGIFNASLDYAITQKIQLSWTSNAFLNAYINIARAIYSNLLSNSYLGNKNLIIRLKNKDFLPHQLAYMSQEELFPEKWASIIEKHNRKLKEAYIIKQVSMTDSIKCGKCKNNKISYQELQTRSGDESMTIFFTCITCGHKWRT
tara:strand:- start:6246 stop:6794 length:549 start_codon:yes stop_codon:yes gene_type:complete